MEPDGQEIERRQDISILAERIAALDRHVTSEITGLKELLKSQREGDQLAIEKALESAQELGEKHNDLIRQMERKDATYATKDQVNTLGHWQARIGGGLVVVGIGVAANAIKVWT